MIRGLQSSSRLCRKTPLCEQSQVAMNERHFDHASEILGCLLEPPEDASALFQSTDQTLDDIAITIRLSIKRYRS